MVLQPQKIIQSFRMSKVDRNRDVNLNSRAVCTPDSMGSSSWYWDEAEVLLVVLLLLPTSSGREEAAEEQHYAINISGNSP